MAAPVVSDFGDEAHDAGETGLTISGFQFGHFTGEAWMYAASDRTGLSDQLTVTAWGDMQLTGVDIPAVPNNANGTVYLFVRTDGMVWSLPYVFTLGAVVASAVIRHRGLLRSVGRMVH